VILTRPDKENPAGETDRAFFTYKGGDPEPLYRAFVAQARIAIWKHLGAGDPTLCHQIAERGLLTVGKFRGDSKISTWFYKIAENECKRELRRLGVVRKRAVQLESIQPGSQDEKKLGNDADRAFRSVRSALDQKSQLGEAVSALSGEQREVVLLKLKGLSFKEIATATGVPPATAASRWRLAKTKLGKSVVKNDKK
jgi:RNA polymerase sigma factor (sigma-70 family)